MLLQYDFAVTQLRYIREAANLIASFRPDGQTPATLLTLIASANPVRGAYVTAGIKGRIAGKGQEAIRDKRAFCQLSTPDPFLPLSCGHIGGACLDAWMHR